MIASRTAEQQADAFGAIDQVVADSLRFKQKLGIGEDAYTSMRLGKTLAQLWDVGGIAVTGGSVAASTTVASTLFASGGWLSAIGLGAAATTPIGWVIGAALATGSAYYGVTRLFRSYHGSRVDVIPKFINTPIDLLGASLMDMLGALSFKVARMDGEITQPERKIIRDYFVGEWGFDQDYTDLALSVVEENLDRATLKQMAAALGAFARDNRDCNFNAIKVELLGLLREVAVADGTLDEREELAIEKVDAVLAQVGSIATAIGSIGSVPSQAVGWASRLIGGKMGKGGPPPSSEQ